MTAINKESNTRTLKNITSSKISNKKNGIVGVILAAGKSSRFGSNKCLHKLPSGIEIGLQSAVNLRMFVSDLSDILCVIPINNPEIKSLFEENGFKTIENYHPESGISSSIKLAIEATKNAKGWLICLADMPNIKATTYQSVTSAMEDQKTIVIPQHQQRSGNPVGLSSQHYEQLMAIEGDKGAKQIFNKNESQLCYVSVDDKGILQDIDTNDDYLAYTK